MTTNWIEEFWIVDFNADGEVDYITVDNDTNPDNKTTNIIIYIQKDKAFSKEAKLDFKLVFSLAKGGDFRINASMNEPLIADLNGDNKFTTHIFSP